MEPLSAIASVITVAQALGVGVGALRTLSNSSDEFNDMVAELSKLKSCMDQLCSTINKVDDPRLSLPAEVFARLDAMRLELGQILNATREIETRLLGKSAPGRKEVKVSVINWQRERRKAIKLRDRAKRCREDLTVCLGLLGVSEHFHQRKIGMELVAASHNNRVLMQSLMTRFDSLEARLIMPESTPTNSLVAYSNALTKISGQYGQNEGLTQAGSPVSGLSTFRRSCPRYCRCKCHLTQMSIVSSPYWMKTITGLLVAEYSTGDLCDDDTNTCQQKGPHNSSLRLGYSFPPWLLPRAVILSASWGSLRNSGASLHLSVPRIHQPYGIARAINEGKLDYFREKFATGELLPTDVGENGVGYFAVLMGLISGPRHFLLAELFLSVGFCSSFRGLAGRTPSHMAKLTLMSSRGFSARTAEETRILERIASLDKEDDSPLGLSTPIRDAVLGIGDISLENTITSDPSQINLLDSMGRAPLHWASVLGHADQATTLLKNGADIHLRSNHDQTALDLATKYDQVTLISLLVKHGAAVDARGAHGCTPLFCSRSADAVKILLAAGANPNQTARIGETALHHLAFRPTAAWEGSNNNQNESQKEILGAMAVLVKAGVDYNLPSRDGDTPIIMASYAGNLHAIRYLWSIGADVTAIDKFGRTMLHHTVIHYGHQQLQLLRELGLCGINPDENTSLGASSVVREFQDRMHSPWFDGQRRVTQRDVFSFYALLTELRQRNWEAGLFLDFKAALEAQGWVQRIRKWLGWQWQMLYDSPRDYGEKAWDLNRDSYPHDYPEDGEDWTSYDLPLFFGEVSVGRDLCCDTEEEDEDEFFDAVSD